MNLWWIRCHSPEERPKRKCPAIEVIAGHPVALRLVVAPRPGLEPGTYGLTVPMAIGPADRAKSSFRLFACQISEALRVRYLPILWAVYAS
jgi:hypothetical protein